jgi:uncharacterized protein (DUF1499 family)
MKLLGKLLLLVVLVVVAVGLYKTTTVPDHLYVKTGTFAACPERPSCVSSLATDDVHRVAALAYTGDPATALSMLREVVERMGGKIAHESPGYLHAVFTTPKMRYRDDLELLVLPEGKIEVRSISRFGYRDFGVNRRRVDELRQAFEAVPQPSEAVTPPAA